MSNLAHLSYPLSCVCRAADTLDLVVIDFSVSLPPLGSVPVTGVLTAPEVVSSASRAFARYSSFAEGWGAGPELTGTASLASRTGGGSASWAPRGLRMEDEEAVAFRESFLRVSKRPGGIVLKRSAFNV